MMLVGMSPRKVSELEVLGHTKHVATISFTIPGEWRIDRQAQRAEACRRRSFNEAASDLAIAVHVQLKPSRALARRLADCLETAVRDGARAKNRVLVGRGARRRRFGV